MELMISDVLAVLANVVVYCVEDGMVEGTLLELTVVIGE